MPIGPAGGGVGGGGDTTIINQTVTGQGGLVRLAGAPSYFGATAVDGASETELASLLPAATLEEAVRLRDSLSARPILAGYTWTANAGEIGETSTELRTSMSAPPWRTSLPWLIPAGTTMTVVSEDGQRTYTVAEDAPLRWVSATNYAYAVPTFTSAFTSKHHSGAATLTFPAPTDWASKLNAGEGVGLYYLSTIAPIESTDKKTSASEIEDEGDFYPAAARRVLVSPSADWTAVAQAWASGTIVWVNGRRTTLASDPSIGPSYIDLRFTNDVVETAENSLRIHDIDAHQLLQDVYLDGEWASTGEARAVGLAITRLGGRLIDAEVKVDDVVDDVSDVTTRVDTVETDASDAKTTADAADTKADEAKTTADAADTKADAADTKADALDTNKQDKLPDLDEGQTWTADDQGDIVPQTPPPLDSPRLSRSWSTRGPINLAGGVGARWDQPVSLPAWGDLPTSASVWATLTIDVTPTNTADTDAIWRAIFVDADENEIARVSYPAPYTQPVAITAAGLVDTAKVYIEAGPKAITINSYVLVFSVLSQPLSASAGTSLGAQGEALVVGPDDTIETQPQSELLQAGGVAVGTRNYGWLLANTHTDPSGFFEDDDGRFWICDKTADPAVAYVYNESGGYLCQVVFTASSKVVDLIIFDAHIYVIDETQQVRAYQVSDNDIPDDPPTVATAVTATAVPANNFTLTLATPYSGIAIERVGTTDHFAILQVAPTDTARAHRYTTARTYVAGYNLYDVGENVGFFGYAGYVYLSYGGNNIFRARASDLSVQETLFDLLDATGSDIDVLALGRDAESFFAVVRRTESGDTVHRLLAFDVDTGEVLVPGVLPEATQTSPGITRYATDDEVTPGALIEREAAVSPSNLANFLATNEASDTDPGFVVRKRAGLGFEASNNPNFDESYMTSRQIGAVFEALHHRMADEASFAFPTDPPLAGVLDDIPGSTPAADSNLIRVDYLVNEFGVSYVAAIAFGVVTLSEVWPVTWRVGFEKDSVTATDLLASTWHSDGSLYFLNQDGIPFSYNHATETLTQLNAAAQLATATHLVSYRGTLYALDMAQKQIYTMSTADGTVTRIDAATSHWGQSAFTAEPWGAFVWRDHLWIADGARGYDRLTDASHTVTASSQRNVAMPASWPDGQDGNPLGFRQFWSWRNRVYGVASPNDDRIMRII